MSSLFKRSNGVYYFVARDQSGRRRWISTGETSKSLALDKFRRREVEVAPSKPRCSLSEFISKLLLHADAIFAFGTVGIYRKSLRHFITSCGNLQLTAIGARHVDAFVDERLKKASPTTVSIEIRTLKSAFHFAMRWKLIDANPFIGVRLPRIDEQLPTFLSRIEFAKLLRSIQVPWLRSMVILAVHTGLRRSELCNLKWNDVDLSHQLIHVRSEGTHRTKTGKRRIVPLNQSAFGLLEGMKALTVGEYVIESEGSRVNPHNVSRVYRKFAIRAGLKGKERFHFLRHSFATALVQHGVPLYNVQRLLGHSSIKVTERYSNLVPDDLQRSVKVLQFDLN